MLLLIILLIILKGEFDREVLDLLHEAGVIVVLAGVYHQGRGVSLDPVDMSGLVRLWSFLLVRGDFSIISWLSDDHHLSFLSICSFLDHFLEWFFSRLGWRLSALLSA